MSAVDLSRLAKVAINLWLYPWQNVLYGVAYIATEERSLSHGHARLLIFAYAAFVLLALPASSSY